MSSRVHVLLDKIDEHLDEVRDHYEEDLTSQELSDELVYAVRQVVQDCQSALDWTATAVRKKYYPRRTGSRPYFPLALEPKAFPELMDKQIKGLRVDHPDIAAAIRKHQPYRKGKEQLGLLKKLARVEKHEDFTPQTRKVTRRVEARSHQGVVSWDPSAVTFGAGVSIGNAPVDPRTQLPVPTRTQTVTQTIYVDWRFVDPDASVLPTLEALGRLVGSAVRGVRRA